MAVKPIKRLCALDSAQSSWDLPTDTDACLQWDPLPTTICSMLVVVRYCRPHSRYWLNCLLFLVLLFLFYNSFLFTFHSSYLLGLCWHGQWISYCHILLFGFLSFVKQQSLNWHPCLSFCSFLRLFPSRASLSASITCIIQTNHFLHLSTNDQIHRHTQLSSTCLIISCCYTCFLSFTLICLSLRSNTSEPTQWPTLLNHKNRCTHHHTRKLNLNVEMSGRTGKTMSPSHPSTPASKSFLLR